MGAFAYCQSLNYEHIALNPLIQKVADMDIGGFSSQSSAWDRAIASSSFEGPGASSWLESEAYDFRERINHHFVEFTDPLDFSSDTRSSVVYPYVPIDRRCNLEDDLLVAWYTSSMPTRIVSAARCLEEAQGHSPSSLAKKAKLCFSDWLDYINAFVPSTPVPSPIIEASTSSSPSPEIEASTPSSPSPEIEASTHSPLPTPCWTERLGLALSADKVFLPYTPPPSPTSAEQKQAQLLLAAFSHLPFDVLEDDVPFKNFRWAYDILTRGQVLNPIAQAELHMFLGQLPLLLHWHRTAKATAQSLDQLSSLQVHAQYESEKLIEKFDDFQNKDSAYGDDMDMDELERGLKEAAFEIRAEELFYQVRAHKLQQPILEEMEDKIKKEKKFIDHSWTTFHDLVIYSIPYFYELELVPKEGHSM